MNINQAVNSANRMERAKEIVPEMRKGGTYDWYNAGDPNIYFVTKKDFDDRRNDATYKVDLAAQSCSCADFTNRGAACKHLLAVEIALEELSDEEMCRRVEEGLYEFARN